MSLQIFSHGNFFMLLVHITCLQSPSIQVIASRETRKRKQELFVCPPALPQMEGLSTYIVVFSIVSFKVL